MGYGCGKFYLLLRKKEARTIIKTMLEPKLILFD